jgi:hypothetical protein
MSQKKGILGITSFFKQGFLILPARHVLAFIKNIWNYYSDSSASTVSIGHK